MATRFRLNFEQIFGTSAQVLAGGTLTFAISGGASDQLEAIYSDDALSVTKLNPVTLDSAGKHGDIFLQAKDYRVIVKDAAGIVQPGGDVDPVHGGIGDSIVIVDGSTTGRSLAEHFADPVNVKDYGAIGDGVADDTAAFNTCFAKTGRRVYIPAGTYKITANLTAPTCSAITGDGHNASILKPTSAVTKLLSLGGGANYPTLLSGLRLDMAATTGTATGAFFGDAGSMAIHVSGFDVLNGPDAGTGIRIGDVLKSRFDAVTVYGCGDGMLVQGVNGAFPTTVTFANCVFANNTHKGVKLLSGYGLQFDNCDFESNGEEGSYIDPISDVTETVFASCWWEDNWTLHAGDPARATYYHHSAQTVSRTVRHAIRDGYFVVGPAGSFRAVTATCRAGQFQGAGVSVTLDNPQLSTGLGQDFKFRVNARFDLPTCRLDVAAAIDDNALGGRGAAAPWYDVSTNLVFNSNLGNTAATFSGIAVTSAQIKQLSGKEWIVQFSWSGTLKAVTPTYIEIVLPTSSNTKTNAIFTATNVTNSGATEFGLMRPSGGNSLYQYRLSGNYTSGSAVGGSFNGVVEFA